MNDFACDFVAAATAQVQEAFSDQPSAFSKKSILNEVCLLPPPRGRRRWQRQQIARAVQGCLDAETRWECNERTLTSPPTPLHAMERREKRAVIITV